MGPDNLPERKETKVHYVKRGSDGKTGASSARSEVQAERQDEGSVREAQVDEGLFLLDFLDSPKGAQFTGKGMVKPGRN